MTGYVSLRPALLAFAALTLTGGHLSAGDPGDDTLAAR